MAGETQVDALLRDDAEPTNDNFVALRTAYKELKGELKELRTFRESAEPRLKANALRGAGFDPESPQAKALLKLHEGEFTDEALKQTASEFGIAASAEGTTPAGGELTAEQKDSLDAAQRAAAIDGVSTPVTPPQTLDAQIKAAEAKAVETGDWSEFDRLQASVI